MFRHSIAQALVSMAFVVGCGDPATGNDPAAQASGSAAAKTKKSASAAKSGEASAAASSPATAASGAASASSGAPADAPPTASGAAPSADAPAAGSVPWAAQFAGEPQGELYGGSSPGDIGVAAHKGIKGWKDLALGNGLTGAENPAKTAMLIEKFGPLTIDAAAIEKWSKPALHTSITHDTATGIIPLGPDKTPARTGHATLTIKGKPAELYWFELATNERGNWLYMAIYKDGCDDTCKKEMNAHIQTLKIGDGQTTKIKL